MVILPETLTIPPQISEGDSEKEMQAKQVNEIAAMVAVGAQIEGVTLTKATRDDKEGWGLTFNYLHRTDGMQACQLITQRNEVRVWVNLNTAVGDVEVLFPYMKEITLILR